MDAFQTWQRDNGHIVTEIDPDGDVITCPDCSRITSGQAIGIAYCPRHKSQSVTGLAAARRANPDVDAIHRMLEERRRA